MSLLQVRKFDRTYGSVGTIGAVAVNDELGNRRPHRFGDILCVTACMLYWRQFNLPRYHGQRYIVFAVESGYHLRCFGAFYVDAAADVCPASFPAVALAMLVAVIFDVRFAAIIMLALGGIGGYVAGNSLETAFYIVVGSLMAIFSAPN